MKHISAKQFAQLNGVNRMFLKARSHLLTLLLGSSLFVSGMATAAGLAPPPYDVKDRHNVNMASGQVSPTQTDISIGGSLGLTHTISTFTSNFVNWQSDDDGATSPFQPPKSPFGVKDKFYGGIYWAVHHYVAGSNTIPELWVARAFDDSSSSDFKRNTDGTFTALSDPRVNLDFVNNVNGFTGYVYTKADGTMVYYASGSATSACPNVCVPTLRMSKIQYPNGLTITINGLQNSVYVSDPISSVTTNTGFQLKYIYVRNHDPVVNDVVNTDIPTADPGTWSGGTPKYVMAINNAVDYCSTLRNDDGQPLAQAITQACPNLSKSWPKVTYDWPAGMPRSMYIRPTTFTVTDAIGKVTEYRHAPYSSYIQGVQNNPNKKVPRLTAIKDASSNVPVMNYDYITSAVISYSDSLYVWYQAGPIAKLSRSWIGTDSINYTVGSPGPHTGYSVNASGGYKAVKTVNSSVYWGMNQVTTWDKVVTLEEQYTNRVIKIDKTIGGGQITFGYDTRGNITSRVEDGITTSASYPATCNSSNRNSCNQADWIQDARGNKTFYTYHSSGQVATITSPADKNNKRAQTRYTYLPRNAVYKIDNVFQTSPTPIYLLASESKCQNTDAVDTGSCSGDEILTQYDYGPTSGANNLLLRGVTVTASGETRRTCYQYDDLGNRIGVTTPRAGLTSCY